MAEITLDQVRKVYPDGTEAVAAVDLEVADGELLVLVGPSGCGKTTLLRMIAGLEDISDGSVRIGGREVNSVAPRHRDIAMVFQNYALYPHMTVFDNMAFALKLRKTEGAERARRVQEAARILGIEELLKRKPRQLSGGQRQRVAMGRAIVREPQAFLMDEPLSNLDAKLRVQMRAEIARIQDELGVTTIYVTHDQSEAMTMGDYVAVMRRGQLQQVAPPQDLYDAPRNLFVAEFIGSPAMNLVHATVSHDDRGYAVEFGGHRLRVDQPPQPLERYVGAKIVIGLRPESIHDAALVPDAPADRRLRVDVGLREAMGADVYVHFEVSEPPVLTEETRDAAAEDDAAIAQLERQVRERRLMFVARLDPATRARERDAIELVVDTHKMYFFDPDTNDALVR